MTAEQLLRSRVAESNRSVASIAKDIRADPELIRKSLNGKRNFKGSELTNLCVFLGVTAVELSETDGWESEGVAA